MLFPKTIHIGNKYEYAYNLQILFNKDTVILKDLT